MKAHASNNELMEILLGEDELMPRKASPTDAGHLVVRGYVLDPDDDAQPRIALLARAAERPSFGMRCATGPGRKWRTAAAQAASETRPEWTPAPHRPRPEDGGHSAPQAGN